MGGGLKMVLRLFELWFEGMVLRWFEWWFEWWFEGGLGGGLRVVLRWFGWWFQGGLKNI